MNTTYKLNWNTLKKGSLIRFTNDGSGAIYRVLTLASDGTAQLMPHRNFALYNQVSYSGTDTDVYNLMSNSAQTNRYYIYTKKLSELSGMSSYDSKLRNLPFYNYLQNEAVNQTIWMVNATPKQSAGVYFICPLGEGDIYRNTFRKTSLQVNNPTLHKWRPLALDDLVDYLGSEPTLDEFVKFWPNLSYGMNKLSSQHMVLYDTGGGYNEYRSGYINADNNDPGYHVLQTGGAFIRSESTSPRFIPVFKVNLRTLLSEQIKFKCVQE